jgi:ribbon-helix-helix CopG family protein
MLALTPPGRERTLKSMSSAADVAYKVNFAPEADEELTKLARKLNVSKDEVLRRALVLFKHAADAKGVELILDDEGKRQKVRLGS